jgi:hypothetical protein
MRLDTTFITGTCRGGSPETYERFSWGGYQISGVATRLGSPGVFRLRLYLMRPLGRPVAETYSNVDGTYTFENLSYKPGGYYIILEDNIEPIKSFQIGSHLTPTPM